jgi:hypothetical protein
LTPEEAVQVAALLRSVRRPAEPGDFLHDYSREWAELEGARFCGRCAAPIGHKHPNARYCSERCQRSAARLRALAASRAAPPPTPEQVAEAVKYCRKVASYSFANYVRPLGWGA